jgi:stage V sporulation protein D (sporulation-specific penicillin-binding protein)
MVTAVAAAVNGGNLVQPYVVRQILDSDGNIVENIEPQIKRQVISETTSAMIREILADSVDEGHGKNARVLGYRIGGKSGTSQKKQSLSGEATEQKYIASFVGFAPADDPEIVVLVLLDEPNSYSTYGGRLAAPVVASVISETLPYLGYEPQYSEEELATVEVSAPNMVGDLTTDAQIKLNAKGLNAVIRGSGTTVTYQYPEAYTTLPRQSTIILYTDEGTEGELTTVPDVVGQTASAASSLLKNAGLNVSTSGAQSDTSGVQAVSQSIEAGTQVKQGTVVEVVLHDTSLVD